jgi:hypothetical protein
MKKSVLVSFPSDPGHPYYHKTVSNVMWKLAQDDRYNLTAIWPTHKPYEHNLHRIIKDFLKGDFDFWLNIDSDNPPLNNPLDLVDLNRDIIGLPTPVWHMIDKKGERPIYWNGYDYVEEEDAYREHMPRKGLQKVDAIGTGCFLLHKRVFLDKEMQKSPFMRTWLEDGIVYKGNDMSFCEKAKRRGFEIHCHYDYPCDHFSELSLNEISKAIQNLKKELE